ncbi:MAG TPA: Gfo/Idh/MocA family oxidoreductase [Thermomicrobiales bacterium]
MTRDRLRLGLVGCGGISRSVYVNLLTGFVDRAEVVAVCDVIPERARERSEQFRDAYARLDDGAGIGAPRVYTDIEQMLGDGGLDAVVVTTQPVMHPVASIAAMNAGLHVFTEGPMAAHLRDADAMIDASRRNGVKLSVQYCTRFFREARQAKLAVASGWLGKIMLGRIDANWFHTMAYFNKDAYRGTWRGEGGGSVFHHGRYASDLYLHLMDEPLVEVAAFTGRFMHDIEYEDASTASLRFASGALGHVTTTICAHRNDAIPYDRVEILGEKASLQVYRGVDWSTAPHGTTFSLTVSSEDDTYAAELRARLDEAIPPGDEDIQVHQMRLFLDALLNDGAVPISGESARAHVELVRATYKSAITGTVVKLPLSPNDPFYGPEGTVA